MSTGAEARLVRYEINGKQYSYSTNNRAQTAEAKKRIAAANAAKAAREKADAEAAQNPLATAFGSKSQKEAADAEEKLEKILSGSTEYMVASKPSEAPSRSTQSRPAPTPRAKAVQRPLPVVRAPVSPLPFLPPPAAPAVAEPVDPQGRVNVRSVSFDIRTGIKTTVLADGAVQEEPFDSSALAFLAPEPETTNSLMAFVNQLRKAAPEEATGSIRTSEAAPRDLLPIRDR